MVKVEVLCLSKPRFDPDRGPLYYMRYANILVLLVNGWHHIEHLVLLLDEHNGRPYIIKRARNITSNHLYLYPFETCVDCIYSYLRKIGKTFV